MTSLHPFLPFFFFFKFYTNDCWVNKQMRILQFILLTTISFCVFSAMCEMLLYVFGIKHVPAVAFSNLK